MSSLLDTRRRLTYKRKITALLRDKLATLDGLDDLFVSMTRPNDVFALAAGIALEKLSPPMDTLPEPAEILLPGVLQCHQRVLSTEELTQAEQLLVSVAELYCDVRCEADPVGIEQLAELCRKVRASQRSRRRSRMNMGRQQD